MLARLLLLLGMVCLCGSAAAQGTITLSLEQGRLRVDGHRVADAYVPPTLDLRRISGQTTYVGPASASIDVGGVRYRVEEGRFVLDHAPTAPPDAVLEVGHRVDLRAGGYVFVPVDWVRDPAEARRLTFAAQQEFALDATAEVLAEQIRALRPGDPERTRLEAQLRACLDEAFAVKQHNRLREIELLEAELRFLRKQHQRRNRHQEEVVAHRLRELLAR